MADGFHGYGTVIKVGDGATSENFTPVASVVRISCPQLNTADIDFSHLESSDQFREMGAGMKSAARVQFSGRYQPAHATHKNTARGLIALWVAQTVVNFQIVLSDGSSSTWAFSGYISSFQPGEAGLDSPVDFTAEITLTAQPTAP